MWFTVVVMISISVAVNTKGLEQVSGFVFLILCFWFVGFEGTEGTLVSESLGDGFVSTVIRAFEADASDEAFVEELLFRAVRSAVDGFGSVSDILFCLVCMSARNCAGTTRQQHELIPCKFLMVKCYKILICDFHNDKKMVVIAKMFQVFTFQPHHTLPSPSRYENIFGIMLLK